MNKTTRRSINLSDVLELHKRSLEMLLETSRTFFIPITQLSPILQETVTSAYLCMRAIDEIEDHPKLSISEKVNLLRTISSILQKKSYEEDLKSVLLRYNSVLPKVSIQLLDWIRLCPASITSNVIEATAKMSKGMEKWVSRGWKINNEKDLDDYTYCVAGLVGELLTELWKWFDNTNTDRNLGIAFGRGLQAVNIIRNRSEDLERGVDFFPIGWNTDDMLTYAKRNLVSANEYTKTIKTECIVNFCRIPLTLALGTLQAIEAGEEKLSRSKVEELVQQVVGE
jgi:farnesyl-diphosphate farnesyltransferase